MAVLRRRSERGNRIRRRGSAGATGCAKRATARNAASGTIPAVKPTVGTIVCPGCGAAPRDREGVSVLRGEVVPTTAAAAAAPHEPRRTAPAARSSIPRRCPRAPAAPDGARCPWRPLPPLSDRLGAHADERRLARHLPTCKGLWFDGSEVERLLDVSTKGKSRDEVDSLREALPRRPSPIEKGTLECVRCRKSMTRGRSR